VVKETRRYFDLNNIVIFSFILIIFISFISNSFSENQSKTNLNNSKINQFPNSTQILANSKIKGNFFFLKDNDIFIPINFFSDNKNLIDNIIYEKDKNYLTVILNKPSFNENSLIIQIPRNILDSKTQDNKDKNFTVLINNKPSKYLEINNKSISKINLNSDDGSELIKNALNNTANRIISIKFDKDSKVIKILGTDLSENQRLVPKIQNSINNGFNFINPIIIITVFFIITVTIYLLYKNGKLKFVKTFKFKREGKNKKV
jgi:hypothetical protein